MQPLEGYLNDHLAGGVAALELLDRLIEVYPGEPLFGDLKREIKADHETLREIITMAGKEESELRKAGAWLMEKVSRTKFQLSENEDGEIGLFLALEALVLGITGKRLLWRALAAAAQTMESVRSANYAVLEERAMEQRDQVESLRLKLAQKVFKSS